MDRIISRNRHNQVNPKPENWKPPVFRPISSRRDKVIAQIRRVFDLPAASIWRDLSDIVPSCVGDAVDVGCGAQPYRELFPATVTYLGIDTEQAPNDFGYSVPDTIYYDGKRWPVSDESVDFVLATETLEHIADVPEFLAEAARCLRTGGRLVLTVPFAARWHFIPHDYWRFTPSGLKIILRSHDFTPTHIWARGNALTVACYKVMALILPLWFPASRNVVLRLLTRLLGILFLPLLVALALIGTLSLREQGGHDCLGYTVVAVLGSARTASTTDAGSSPDSPRKNC